MGGQKAKIKNNALITQFFKKAAPAAPTLAHSGANDENALTESEIAAQNRRVMQRGGLGTKKKPVFRHALAQVVHEEGDDMRRVVLGGLKNMDNVPLPTRREPGFSVLSDNTSASGHGLKKPTEKYVAMPKGWDYDDEGASAAASTTRDKALDENASAKIKLEKDMPKSRGNSDDGTECGSIPVANLEKDLTRPGPQGHTARVGTAASIQGEKQPTAQVQRAMSTEKLNVYCDDNNKVEKTIPNKRLVEEELLITTTRRKVLGPKTLIRRQQSEEEDMQKETRSSKIPHSLSFFDNDDSKSGNDESQLSPLEFSISDSVSFPPVPRNNHCHSPSSPTSEAFSDDINTIPLTHPEYYEEHPAFPVPRGKTLIEKLGINETKERDTEDEDGEGEVTSITSSPPSYIV